MTLKPSSKGVLLTLDIQPAILELGEVPPEILETATKVVRRARDRGLKIIHVATGFADGYPELQTAHPPLPMWHTFKEKKMLLKSSAATQVHQAIYQPGDTLIWKTRASAFVRTDRDLDKLLKDLGAGSVIMFGVATSGAVLSTVRSGWDLDWNMTVIKDACYDRDQGVHEFLMAKVIAERASVMSADDFWQ